MGVLWQGEGLEETSIPALAQHPRVRELIRGEIERANAKVAQVGAGKGFIDLGRQRQLHHGMASGHIQLQTHSKVI